jgi:hypothetical protein
MEMSSRDRLDVIDTTVQKTYAWLKDLSAELGGITLREAWQPAVGAHA